MDVKRKKEIVDVCFFYKTTGEFYIKVGEFYIKVGEFYIKVGEFCIETGEFYITMGEFYIETGEFYITMGEFYIETGEFYTEVIRIYRDFYREVCAFPFFSSPKKSLKRGTRTNDPLPQAAALTTKPTYFLPNVEN